MRTLLTLCVVFAAPASPANLWPRLHTYSSPATCSERLAVDPTEELLSFLDLTHPFLRRYLELNTRPDDVAERAFRADVRAVALIYGDQPVLDLRRHGGPGPFVAFNRDLRLWALRPSAHRRQLAREFVEHLVRLDWGVRHDDDQTIYLNGLEFAHAFRTDGAFDYDGLALASWDIDDPAHLVREFYYRLEDLRGRLARDDDFRRTFERRLAHRLGTGNLAQATTAVRRFVSAYRKYLERRAKSGDLRR